MPLMLSSPTLSSYPYFLNLIHHNQDQKWCKASTPWHFSRYQTRCAHQVILCIHHKFSVFCKIQPALWCAIALTNLQLFLRWLREHRLDLWARTLILPSIHTLMTMLIVMLVNMVISSHTQFSHLRSARAGSIKSSIISIKMIVQNLEIDLGYTIVSIKLIYISYYSFSKESFATINRWRSSTMNFSIIMEDLKHFITVGFDIESSFI